MIRGEISGSGSKSANILLGTALLEGMKVGLNYSTSEIIIERGLDESKRRERK